MPFLQEAILATPAGWGSAVGVPETRLPEGPPSADAEGLAGKEPGLLDGVPSPPALGGGEGGGEGGAADG